MESTVSYVLMWSTLADSPGAAKAAPPPARLSALALLPGLGPRRDRGPRGRGVDHAVAGGPPAPECLCHPHHMYR